MVAFLVIATAAAVMVGLPLVLFFIIKDDWERFLEELEDRSGAQF